MSDLFVDNIKHQSSQGSGTITLGTSGETIALASGASVTGNGLVGITEIDQWRLTANITTNTDPISSNLERIDSTGFGYIGTGMSVSSGLWTFPSTGIYLILFNCDIEGNAGDNIVINLFTTTDNGSNYNAVAEAVASATNATINQATQLFIFDVTNTSTHKVKFTAGSIGSGGKIRGDTDETKTSFTFIRIGDT